MVNKEEKRIDGRILIWAKYEEDGKKMMLKKLNLYDIMSIDEVIKDLIGWQDKEYFNFLNKKEEVIRKLFKTFRK